MIGYETICNFESFVTIRLNMIIHWNFCSRNTSFSPKYETLCWLYMVTYSKFLSYTYCSMARSGMSLEGGANVIWMYKTTITKSTVLIVTLSTMVPAIKYKLETEKHANYEIYLDINIRVYFVKVNRESETALWTRIWKSCKCTSSLIVRVNPIHYSCSLKNDLLKNTKFFTFEVFCTHFWQDMMKSLKIRRLSKIFCRRKSLAVVTTASIDTLICLELLARKSAFVAPLESQMSLLCLRYFPKVGSTVPMGFLTLHNMRFCPRKFQIFGAEN